MLTAHTTWASQTIWISVSQSTTVVRAPGGLRNDDLSDCVMRRDTVTRAPLASVKSSSRSGGVRKGKPSSPPRKISLETPASDERADPYYWLSQHIGRDLHHNLTTDRLATNHISCAFSTHSKPLTVMVLGFGVGLRMCLVSAEIPQFTQGEQPRGESCAHLNWFLLAFL